jgi:raffinose/stachyose/melibiose transport system permease protein
MKRLGLYIILSIFTLAILIPFFLTLLTAFKTQKELSQRVFKLPESFSFNNFIQAWNEGRFNIYFLNSIIVIIPVVILATFFSILCAYALAHLPLPGRAVVFGLFLLGLILPLEGLIIPLYYALKNMRLLDTYWALILPEIALSIPFGSYMLWASFKSAPQSLVDAAVIDGASRNAILWNVLVPLARPTINVLITFFFIWNWNEFLMPLILISNDDLRTLPVGLAFFQGRYTVNIPLLAAGATMVSLPLIIIYLIFQRQFIRGLTTGIE